MCMFLVFPSALQYFLVFPRVSSYFLVLPSFRRNYVLSGHRCSDRVTSLITRSVVSALQTSPKVILPAGRADDWTSRWTDKQTDGRADGRTSRRMDEQTDGRADRRRSRRTYEQTEYEQTDIRAYGHTSRRPGEQMAGVMNWFVFFNSKSKKK